MLNAPHEVMLRRIHWILLGALAMVAASYSYLYTHLPLFPKHSPAATAPFQWERGTQSLAPEAWAVFRLQGGAPSSLGPLGKRFRLAGTFFAFGEGGENDGAYCKAILDDVAKGEQYLVKEGDVLEDVQVVRIYADRILLRDQGQEEELWLSFAHALSAKPAEPSQAEKQPVTATETPVLEQNRFGKRVGEFRWVLSRDALMAYYRQLLDDPERLAQIYVSMKPDYKEGAIAGYRVDIEGEGELLHAAGLQNGDIIRKVNSMIMTSQRRAEFFIGEFTKNRLSAVVLDVERDNQPKKLIYLIR
jgi:type II secretory pathway component PulC